MNQLVARRLEFLNMEGKGFPLVEIVKHLSKKYHKSERMIYHDAENRNTWQPTFSQLFELDKARLVVVNRYETIYREAAFMLIQNEDKPAALRIMLDTTKQLVELLGLSTVAHDQAAAASAIEAEKLVQLMEEYQAAQRG